MVVSLVELLLITMAVGLFASGKSYQPMMTGGIVLLVIAWLVRWGYDRRWLRPTKLDWPLRLFVVSGLISLWATHDFGTSLAKFWLIVGSIALYYALNQAPFKVRFYFALGLVSFAALLALYFITQENEIAAIGAPKFPLLTDLHATLRALSPQFHLYAPHPNLVAGVLEVALVIGVGLIMISTQAWPVSAEAVPTDDLRSRSLPLQIILIVLVALIVFAFLLTGSRGGWLAVAIAGLGWFLSEMRQSSRLRTLDSLAVLIILASVIFWLFMQLNDPTESQLSGEGSGISRLTLYQGSSQLVRDYVFTGAGLGSFPMLYSAYVLRIEVVKLNHPHNLYLAVWLEQGLLGFVALLWLVGAFIVAFWQWRKHRPDPAKSIYDRGQHLLGSASFWAAVIIFLHGFIDSVHYDGRFLPLIFIALGLGGLTTLRAKRARGRTHAPSGLYRNLAIAAGLLALVIVLAWTPLRASWYANLGAVQQSKIELNNYSWEEGRIPGRVRATADLSEPIALFERALALTPNNPTAQERLSIIETVIISP